MATKNVDKVTANAEVVRVDSDEVGVSTLSTFATDSLADRKRAYVAIDSAKNLREADMVGKDLNLTNVALVNTEMLNEDTGEFERTTQVVLEVAEGESYTMFSDALAGSVRQFLQAFGAPASWEESVTVRVVSKLTRKGHTFYKLDVVL